MFANSTESNTEKCRKQPKKPDKDNKAIPEVLAAIPVVILHKEAALVIACLIIYNAQHIFPHPQGLHAPAHNPHTAHTS